MNRIEWTGDNYKEVQDFCKRNDGFSAVVFKKEDILIVITYDGPVHAEVGDFIVKIDQDSYYLMKGRE